MSIKDGYEIEILGKKAKLKFSWNALNDLEQAFPSENIAEFINKAKAAELAKIAAIGFKEINPEIDEAAVMSSDIPVFVLKMAIDRALSVAYFGTFDQAEILEIVQGDKKK